MLSIQARPDPFTPRSHKVWILALGLVSCGSPTPMVTPEPAASPPVPAESPEVQDSLGLEQSPSGPPVEPMIHPEPLARDLDTGAAWVERTLREMTVREKAGQLIMPWVLGDFAPEGSSSHDRVLDYIEEEGIGGVIMSVGSPTEVAAKLNDFQVHSKYPLLVGADLETGAGFRMRGAVQMPGTIELGGATDFPSLMALGAAGDTELAYVMGRVTAVEARAVGIHVPFAPVLDVNNNPDNPVINVRSFGEDPAQVAALGAAFVRGVQENGGIATGKHFPGHGDTDVDSHMALPLITHDRARMDSVELFPFQAAIDAGMGAVMTAHISVPSLNNGLRDPATLSAAILTDLLREDMHFDGLLFTDAMDMSAISTVLKKPLCEPLRPGPTSSLCRPRQSVRWTGSWQLSSRGAFPRPVWTIPCGDCSRPRPEWDFTRSARCPLRVSSKVSAYRSMSKQPEESLRRPSRFSRTAGVMSVSYRRESDVLAGRYFNRRLRSTYPRLTNASITRDSNVGVYEGLMRQARQQALVVVSTYVTAVSYQGSMALPEELIGFIEDLDEAGIPHVVVSFGNPYLVTTFPDVRAYMLAWSGSEASQRAAAGALFGEFDIEGRIPTRIPPLYEIGDGLTIPSKENTSGRN